MQNSFSFKIEDFSAKIELKEQMLSICLKSLARSFVLFAHYAPDNLPSRLTNVINSPQQLYSVLQSLGAQQMSVSQQDELVIKMQMFNLKREYRLPMERTDLSNQDKLLYQLSLLREEMKKVEEQLHVARLKMAKAQDKYLDSQKKYQEIKKSFALKEQERNIWSQQIECLKQQNTNLLAKLESQKARFQQTQQRLMLQIEYMQKRQSKNSLVKQLFKGNNGSGLKMKPQLKNVGKWNFEWDPKCKNNAYFNINNKKIARNSSANWHYIQLTSKQAIAVNPSEPNYQVTIKVCKYGYYGGIIVGVTTEERRNEKFSGGTAKGQRELSLSYRTYQSKGEYKGKIYEMGAFKQIVPFVPQLQTVTMEIDNEAQLIYWSTQKQGLVHVSSLQEFSGKWIVFFTTMYESGDSIEIL